jgi:hypothetical protein
MDFASTVAITTARGCSIYPPRRGCTALVWAWGEPPILLPGLVLLSDQGTGQPFHDAALEHRVALPLRLIPDLDQRLVETWAQSLRPRYELLRQAQVLDDRARLVAQGTSPD